jgi:hypothetical protein
VPIIAVAEDRGRRPQRRQEDEMNEQVDRNAETDRLLLGIDDELTALDALETADQVQVYDRVHTTLADALARTADTGVPPAPGDPGA